jgi:spore coat polysaccharide biosynthesis protein SpsF (cytidylyltransferase family)
MTTDEPLVVVHASVAATRLRDAVVADVAGMPALELLLRRLDPLRGGHGARLLVGTSDLAADDPVADIAAGLGLPVVRGTAGDVVGIHAIALVRHEAETVVHLDGTCPLSDPYVVLAALELHRSAEADLTTNLLPRTYPRGLDVEVLSSRAVRAAELEATHPDDRRAVTPFVAQRPERFRLANLHSGHDLGEERWVLDTAADLAALKELLAQVPDPVGASWNRILSIVGRRVRPLPDKVVLRPERVDQPTPGPWTRRWQAVVNGQGQGTVSVTVHRGKVEREVLVAEPWLEPARDALYRLLLDDPQIRR